jgi:DNA repair protein RecO (recombination protein O)
VPLIVTEALVLHVLDYRETSRIFRLATREAGVCSVIARGARRPKSRFGAALDLFAEGTAQLITHPHRDLHTLAAFDVTRARTPIAARWDRFTAASALAELVMRIAEGEPHEGLFDVVQGAFDHLAAAGEGEADRAGLAGAWAVLNELGFSPALDACVRCDVELPREVNAHFVPALGGVLCPACATLSPPGRRLPATARRAIGLWLEGGDSEPVDAASTRAHQRLLREFIQAHLGDGRPLRALEVWEQGAS